MNISLFCESIFVGIYCVFIYLSLVCLFSRIPLFSGVPLSQLWFLLVIVGFIKHLFGYLLGIQQSYCGCIYFKQSFPALFIECLIESLLFLLVGSALHILIQNKILLFFSIGVLLHTMVEFIGGHSLFCMTKCGQNYSRV